MPQPAMYIVRLKTIVLPRKPSRRAAGLLLLPMWLRAELWQGLANAFPLRYASDAAHTLPNTSRVCNQAADGLKSGRNPASTAIRNS